MTRPVREYSPPRDAGHRDFRLAQVERKAGGDWIYVVTSPSDPLATPESPLFTNGGNAGGDWQVLRFRWLIDSGLDIEGVVSGVVPGDVIFTLPSPLYIRYAAGDGDLAVPGVNVLDNSHAAFQIKTNGDVVYLG